MRIARICTVTPYIIVPVIWHSGPPLVSVLDASTLAGSPLVRGSSKVKGDRERERAILKGKGFFFQCHGQDGDIDRRPVMDPEIARVIEQLNPKIADLRNPATLKSKNDAERFTTIREGHRGTAMFP